MSNDIYKKPNTNYIYLVKLRQFIKTNENIYKIGRTSQNCIKTISQYPKGSEIIIFRKCINSINLETELIKNFKIKYKHQESYGNQYFEGNEINMINDINNFIDNEINIDLNENNDEGWLLFSQKHIFNMNIELIKKQLPSIKKDSIIHNDLSKPIIINTYNDLVNITDNKIYITISDKNTKSGYYQLKNDYRSYFFGENMDNTLFDILYDNFAYYSDICYMNTNTKKYISCNNFHLIKDSNK